MAESKINVEVAYAEPEQQVIVQVNVDKGASVQQAITASGILKRFSGIDLRNNPVGVFGKVCPLQQAVKEGDRVEIYRQLVFDPKEHRRLRAAGQK
jgi:uncharacterized protein